MSRTKEFYFKEINEIENLNDFIDEEYFYELWKNQMEEDEFIEKYYEENKERLEGERIFTLTNTYPF